MPKVKKPVKKAASFVAAAGATMRSGLSQPAAKKKAALTKAPVITRAPAWRFSPTKHSPVKITPLVPPTSALPSRSAPVLPVPKPAMPPSPPKPAPVIQKPPAAAPGRVVVAPSAPAAAPKFIVPPTIVKPVLPLKPVAAPPVPKPPRPAPERVVAPPPAPAAAPERVVSHPPETAAAPERVVVAPPAQPVLKPLSLKVPLTVKELAEKLFVSPSDVIKRLFGMKILSTMNQLLTEEPVKTVLVSYGYEYQRMPSLEETVTAFHEEQDVSKLVHRPPVVTLMGHVDHGKTSLLDAIRKSSIAQKEAGGITQHIGAYQVLLPKGAIAFLDTPGHEAFTAMRARGAHVTDVVVLVVAADDGVMPQTVEAIDHAKAAEATIVVALNKIDKPGSNPDRVKKQLMELGLTPEEWGGKTIVAAVSAKTREGIDQLLESILLEAELLELKADPTKPARGIVLEAKLSKGGGPVAHILVQNGTLRIGDVLVSGPYWGRVRAMLDERGHRLGEAGPSTPVELLGLSGVPKAGELFLTVPDERQAREISAARQEELRGKKVILRRAVTLEDFHRQLEEGRLKSLNLILKADVQGSAEALKGSLEKIFSEEVSLKFLHVGVGDITEPDVLLAEASSAVVIGFHVQMTPEADVLAKEAQVDVRLYRIIYEAVNDIRAALEGLLTPKTVEQVMGKAKVLQVFKVSKAGTVAGCQVLKGKIVRGAVARVYRGEEQLFQGRIASLKRLKDDVREVAEGFQCGISVSGWDGFQPEDLIEAIEVEQVAQKL